MFVYFLLSRRVFDSTLEDKFKALPARLELYSEYILRNTKEKSLNDSDNLYSLLSAWKDLVISLAKVSKMFFSSE